MGEVRIIAGRARGRKIRFPDIPGLRPSPDRVRVTLFNWLMPYIQNAMCLDAFAGSGALGLEAWSRGAQYIDFIEQNPILAQSIQEHAKLFGAEQKVAVHQSDALSFLAQTKNKLYDIIFLDPPFQSALYVSIIEMIETYSLLTPGGLLYVEAASLPVLSPGIWRCLKEKKAGLVHYALFEKLVEKDPLH